MVLAPAFRHPILIGWHGALVAILVTLAATLVLLETPAARAVPDPVTCASSVGLFDGGFEQPEIPANTFQLLDESLVPGWETTATDGLIELWRAPFYGVPPGGGEQFAELNGTEFSSLYHDQSTVPGTVLRWSLLHRGRDGYDTMAVSIGPADGPLDMQRVIADDYYTWGEHSGSYVVPAGQTTTRFSFEALSSAGGDPRVGNLLDEVSFGTNACVVATGSVSSSTGAPYAQAGDVLTSTVDAAGAGGTAATDAVLRDVLPAGVTFVPGSLRVTTGDTTTAVSDAAGDDEGEYDPVSRTFTVRVGYGATAVDGGSLREGQSSRITYQVTVDPSPTPTTLVDDWTVTYVDPLTATTGSATTDPVSIRLNPIADMSAAFVRDSAGPVVAGSPVRYRATATSQGGDPAYGARLTGKLPAALVGATATTADGRCSIRRRELACDFGLLPPGTERTVTLTGTVAADTPTGSALTVRGTASSLIRDLTPANDSASVTDTVTVAADLAVELDIAPSAPPAGAEVTFTAVVTNHGPSTARSIVLTESIFQDGALPPAPTELRASMPGAACSAGVTPDGELTVECSLPDLAPGTSATATIVFRSAPDRVGVLDSKATVTSETPETAPEDNEATVRVDLATSADLGLTLTTDPTPTVAGRDVTYTAVITNRGPSTAREIVFTDSIVQDGGPPPPSYELRPSSPGAKCTARTPTGGTRAPQCFLTALAPGESATVTIVFRSVPDRPGTLLNTATVRSATTETAPADNTATAGGTLITPADVGVTLTVPPGNVPPGGRTTFTLTITNDGPSTAKDTTIGFTLPAGLTIAFDEGAPCSTAASCTIASLASGRKVTVTGTLSASTSTVGARPVTAVATSATTDPDPADNTARATVLVGAGPLQLSVIGAITDDRRARGADVGDEVYWTYVVTNVGNVPVEDVDAVLPDGTPVPGGTTCRRGSLPAGATTACRSARPQVVSAADVRSMAVSTDVQAVGSWADGTRVRTQPVTGWLDTVLPTSTGTLSGSLLEPTSAGSTAPSAGSASGGVVWPDSAAGSAPRSFLAAMLPRLSSGGPELQTAATVTTLAVRPSRRRKP